MHTIQTRFRSPWLVALLWVVLPTLARARPITWEHDAFLAQAVKRAQKQNMQLLIKIGVQWCPGCLKLQKELANPVLARHLKRYIRLAYDAEIGEGQDVARRYNAIAFPTLLVVGPDGLELDRITGELPAADLLKRLQSIKDGSGTLAKLEQKLGKTPDDFELRLEVGTAWAFKGDRQKAEEHLNRLIEADPKNKKGFAAKAMLVKGKYLQFRSLNDFKQAEQTLRALRSIYSDSDEARSALYPLARVLHRQKKTKAALKMLTYDIRSAADHRRVAFFCLRENVELKTGLNHALLAAKQEGERAKHWSTLAEIQELVDQSKQALVSWTKALSLDPTNTWYKDRLEQLKLASKLSTKAKH